jgi:hypothetical protein
MGRPIEHPELLKPDRKAWNADPDERSFAGDAARFEANPDLYQQGPAPKGYVARVNVWERLKALLGWRNRV